MDYSPWGHRESDMTEVPSTHAIFQALALHYP